MRELQRDWPQDESLASLLDRRGPGPRLRRLAELMGGSEPATRFMTVPWSRVRDGAIHTGEPYCFAGLDRGAIETCVHFEPTPPSPIVMDATIPDGATNRVVSVSDTQGPTDAALTPLFLFGQTMTLSANARDPESGVRVVGIGGSTTTTCVSVNPNQPSKKVLQDHATESYRRECRFARSGAARTDDSSAARLRAQVSQLSLITAS